MNSSIAQIAEFYCRVRCFYIGSMIINKSNPTLRVMQQQLL